MEQTRCASRMHPNDDGAVIVTGNAVGWNRLLLTFAAEPISVCLLAMLFLTRAPRTSTSSGPGRRS